MEVPPRLLALGGIVTLRGVDGKLVEVKVKPQTTPGTVIRVPDCGMPVEPRGRGTALIELQLACSPSQMDAWRHFPDK